jgi:hypothetical protein
MRSRVRKVEGEDRVLPMGGKMRRTRSAPDAHILVRCVVLYGFLCWY